MISATQGATCVSLLVRRSMTSKGLTNFHDAQSLQSVRASCKHVVT